MTVPLAPARTTAFTARPDELAALTTAVAETADHYDRSGEFPADGLAAVHRAGVFAAVVDERFGGGGLGPLDRLRTVQAIGQGDPSVALIFANTLAAHVAQSGRGGCPKPCTNGSSPRPPSGRSRSTPRVPSPSSGPPRGAACPPRRFAARPTAGYCRGARRT